MKRISIIGGLAAVLLAVSVAVPHSAPIPAAFRAQDASASPQDCWQVAKNTYKVAKAGAQKNGPKAVVAFVSAIRRTNGCGDTMADWLCVGSQHRWGYVHRAIVRGITGGDYSTC